MKILWPVCQNCILWVHKKFLGFFQKGLLWIFSVLTKRFWDFWYFRWKSFSFPVNFAFWVSVGSFWKSTLFEKIFNCLIVFESRARSFWTFRKKFSSVCKSCNFLVHGSRWFFEHSIFLKCFQNLREMSMEPFRKMLRSECLKIACCVFRGTLWGNRFFFDEKSVLRVFLQISVEETFDFFSKKTSARLLKMDSTCPDYFWKNYTSSGKKN